MVEPFSAQEHGAAGSSYDTGVRFSSEVFGYDAPIPGVRYANIHMLGDTKKMSSSKGNLVTPGEALQIMPPEVLRYFVVRRRPERTLYWDSGQGLFNLIREFATTKEIVEDGGAAEYAMPTVTPSPPARPRRSRACPSTTSFRSTRRLAVMTTRLLR